MPDDHNLAMTRDRAMELGAQARGLTGKAYDLHWRGQPVLGMLAKAVGTGHRMVRK